MPHSPAGSAADGAGEKSFADIETEIQRQSEQLRGTGKHPRQLLDRLADIYRKATPTLPEQTRSAVSEAAAPGPVAAAPTHSSELAKVLADATSAAHIDVAVPVNSRVPLGGLLKSGVRRLTSFYFQFVAYQIGLLGIRLVRALRVVADAGSAGTQVPAAPTVAQPEMPPAITQHLVEHLTGTQGRVLVLDSAGTELIDTLESAGIDTYGIAPDITIPAGAAGHAELGHDLRHVRVDAHLAVLPDHCLGGAVLTGFADQAAIGRKLALLDDVLDACAAGARLAVVTTTADDWRARLGPVGGDLVEGRPLGTQTWEFLLAERGVLDVATFESAADGCAVVTGRLA